MKTHETAPEVLPTPNGGLSPDRLSKGNPMGTANPTQNGFDPKPFILKALRHAAQDHQNAREMSAECVKQGRELGLTWDQLGHALNMSPNALRMRITRKGEAIR